MRLQKIKLFPDYHNLYDEVQSSNRIIHISEQREKAEKEKKLNVGCLSADIGLSADLKIFFNGSDLKM